MCSMLVKFMSEISYFRTGLKYSKIFTNVLSIQIHTVRYWVIMSEQWELINSSQS